MKASRLCRAAALLALPVACAVLCTACRVPAEEEPKEFWDAKPSVMIDGVLYGDTGKSALYRTEDRPEKGGHTDGEITASVESHQYPEEDGQSNFGIGFPYRYGEEGTVEIFFDSTDKWIIFEAYRDR